MRSASVLHMNKVCLTERGSKLRVMAYNVTYCKDTGVMATLPSPPFVLVSGVPNFRDLGGYAISQQESTWSIRTNFVYRCGEPSRITQEGIRTLQSLGISHIFDLRSNN